MTITKLKNSKNNNVKSFDIENKWKWWVESDKSVSFISQRD